MLLEVLFSWGLKDLPGYMEIVTKTLRTTSLSEKVPSSFLGRHSENSPASQTGIRQDPPA